MRRPMLVVVNSMPKCGSTWLYHYVTQCLTALGHPPAPEVLSEWPIALNHHNNPGALDGDNLRVLLDAALETTFAVKSHTPPNPELLSALEMGAVRMVFLVRHPAEIVRSALAFGAASRAKGWDEPYAAFATPGEAAGFVAPFIAMASAWMAAAPRTVRHYDELFAGDERIRDAVHRLVPGSRAVSAPILDRMKPERLSAKDRDWLRVNLVSRPPLDADTAAQCGRWAAALGFAAASA
jgi:hypothetical protein